MSLLRKEVMYQPGVNFKRITIIYIPLIKLKNGIDIIRMLGILGSSEIT
jgi:hypothetical protein